MGVELSCPAMPAERPTDHQVLDELDALRRESVARSAEVKRLAADVHRVLGRKAMAGALLGDTRNTARRLPGWLGDRIAELRRRMT